MARLTLWKRNNFPILLNMWKNQEVTSILWFKQYIAAAAAKSLQSCPTLCDPIDGSPPGSPSLGFSRQEHWSGLPFPSPMHESEKWKWSCSVVSDSSWPHGLQSTRLLHPWDFPGKSTGVGCHGLLPISKAAGIRTERCEEENKRLGRHKKGLLSPGEQVDSRS